MCLKGSKIQSRNTIIYNPGEGASYYISCGNGGLRQMNYRNICEECLLIKISGNQLLSASHFS